VTVIESAAATGAAARTRAVDSYFAVPLRIEGSGRR